MKKILFSTEFSDHAPIVFRYALELANVYDATIILGSGYGKPETGTSIQDDTDRERALRSKLEKFAKHNTPDDFRKINMEIATELDYPASALLTIAQEHRVDMVVISMTGRSIEPDQHFSDITTTILRRAQCPVLAIPYDIPFLGFKKIVFSTDFQYNDLIAMNLLVRWSEDFDSTITILRASGKKGGSEVEREKLLAMREAYREKDTLIEIEIINGERPRKAILDYVHDNEADLLVMTTNHRSYFWSVLEGSTTRRIARRIRIPLLVIKDDDDTRGADPLPKE